MPRNNVGQELEAISSVLDYNRDILELIYQDLIGLRQADTGRLGLSAEQVLRGAILKQYRQLTFEELTFHLEDSASFRAVARLKMGQYPSDSTLQESIKAISPSTWEAVNRVLIESVARQDAEKGRIVRFDATAVDANIHHPTDSTLADKVRGYALEAIGCLRDFVGADLDQSIAAKMLVEELEKMLIMCEKVMDQARRRVLQQEKVPATEKVVSLFECHADVIVKGGRDTQYGHKIFLAGGSSGLILDCLVASGNPADARMYPTLLER
jgi:transposase, IS5 family